MTKIINIPRGSGKTDMAIRIAHKNDSYIICRSMEECGRIAHVAESMGINIRYPISWGEFARGQFYRPSCESFVVDDCFDLMLEALFAGSPVTHMTLSIPIEAT